MTSPKRALNTFISRLEAAEILRPEDWERVKQLAKAAHDLPTFSKRLIEKELLTDWQVKQLAAARPFVISRYLLLDKIGQGGMGTVYRAMERGGMRRIVALKIVNKDALRKDSTRERFLREVQAIAALNHPQIVTAYDADLVDEGFLLAMEYVPAPNLRQWLKAHGPLPVEWSCEAIRQACLGLEHAHKHGIIHRDIKPANLLASAPDVQTLPQVKLLDLGLARLVKPELDADEATKSNIILGTIEYISPEQARSTKHADERSDIFSMGATLYRLLTDEVPFPGNTLAEQLVARAAENTVSVRMLRPDIPANVDQLVAEMLQRSPEHRPQTAAEVAKRLADVLNPTVKSRIAVEPNFNFSQNQPEEAQTRSSRLGFGWIAAGVLFVILGIAGGIFFGFRESEPVVGQLELTIDQPQADVLVDGKKLASSPGVRGPFVLELPVGERVILVRKAGFSDQLRRLVIRSDAPNSLSIQLAEDEPVPDFVPVDVTPEDFTDRSVAGWVLRRGGSVWLRLAGGQRRFLNRYSNQTLPRDSFQLTWVRLSGSGITDEALPYLASLKGLDSLDLSSNPITDAGIVALQGHPRLRQLELSETSISDAGASTLRTLKGLERLELEGNRGITDEAILQLRDLQNLKFVSLTSTEVSERSLAVFATWKQLDRLELRGTNISATEAGDLRSALPDCEIDLFEARFANNTLSTNWQRVSGDIQRTDYRWSSWKGYQPVSDQDGLRAKSGVGNVVSQSLRTVIDTEIPQRIYLSFTLNGDPKAPGRMDFVLTESNAKPNSLRATNSNVFVQYNGSDFRILGHAGPTKPLVRGRDYLVVVRLDCRRGQDRVAISCFAPDADVTEVFDEFQFTSKPTISAKLNQIVVGLNHGSRIGNIRLGHSLSDVGINRAD